MLSETMLSDTGIGLAQADRDIAEAERNIRHLETLIPQIADKGYSTAEVEDQVQAMTQMLAQLKSQRWEIEGLLDEPYALNG
jgi:hypothetical protein